MWMGIGRGPDLKPVRGGGPGYPSATASRATMLGITSITASTGHSTRPGSSASTWSRVMEEEEELSPSLQHLQPLLRILTTSWWSTVGGRPRTPGGGWRRPRRCGTVLRSRAGGSQQSNYMSQSSLLNGDNEAEDEGDKK